MKKYLICISLFLFLAAISGCDDDPNSPPEPVNDAPEIITISASPSAIGKSQTSRLSVMVIDKNGDELSYQWSSPDGAFLQRTNSKITTWRAPAVPGSYECQVQVSDGIDTTIGVVTIDVVEVAILKIADEPVDFSYNLTSQKMIIENAGSEELTWTVTPKASWITVNPVEGTTNTESDEIEVTINRTGFKAGDFHGLIGVESNGGSIDVLVKCTVLITPEMVFVAAGQFKMGSLSGAPDEQPVQPIFVDDFWIDKYEVTNQQYVDFLNELYANNDLLIDRERVVVKDGKKLIHFYDVFLANRGIDCPINFENDRFITVRGTENWPVCFLTWYGAKAYAEHNNKRLPTEAEWEKAASGTNSSKYPWGNSEPTKWDCNFTMHVGHPTMVGSYSPLGESEAGCADMAGNSWEWCSSIYKPYPFDPGDGREDLSAEGYRVIRGGGWDSLSLSLRGSIRYYCDPAEYYPSYGMRCVRSNN